MRGFKPRLPMETDGIDVCSELRQKFRQRDAILLHKPSLPHSVHILQVNFSS